MVKFNCSLAPTQFLSLPNELLLDIFENYDLSIELYRLGATCKRLNHLALPIFLAQCGIEDPVSEISLQLIDKYATVTFSAVRSLLSLKRVSKLSCVLPHCPQPPFYPGKEFHMLCELVEQLEHVDEMTLVLDDRGRYTGITGNDDVLRAWSSTMGRLLNALVERSCVSLMVQNGYVLTHSYELRPTSTDIIPFTMPYMTCLDTNVGHGCLSEKSDAALQVPGWEFYRPTEQGLERVLTQMSYSTRKSCVLREFRISSPILLLLPCSNWTLSALQCPSVTHLTLSRVILSPDVWSAMLPCICSILQDRLLELVITNCRTIPASAILEPLAQLRHLQHLILDRHLPFLADSLANLTPLEDGPHFEDLRVLEAPSDYVHRFFSPLKSRSLPRLERVCISPRTMSLPIFRVVESMPTLSSIIKRLGHCPNVELNLLMEVPCTPSMVHDAQHLSQLVSDNGSVQSASLYRDADETYGRVKTITLDGFCVLFDSPEALCNWVVLFRNVEVVRLSWPLSVTREQNGLELEQSIATLVDTSRHLCGSVRKLILDERVYPL